jgi:hypothetical protein
VLCTRSLLMSVPVAWPVRSRGPAEAEMRNGLWDQQAGQWQWQRQRQRQWQWPVVALFVGIWMAVLPWPATTRSVEVACHKRRAAASPPTRTHEAVPGGLLDFVQGGTQRIEQGSAGAVGGEDITAAPGH